MWSIRETFELLIVVHLLAIAHINDCGGLWCFE